MTPPADQALETAVEAAFPAGQWRDVHLVAAVSGGADSVALLRALARNKQAAGGAGRLVAAHFNHRLRGEDSDADERWVGQLCQQLEIPLEVGHAATDKPPCDSEESARDARYAFLLAAAERLGARYVATAHTRDDNVETILFRLFRGTGLAGLAGIPRERELSGSVTAVRPLLDVSRHEVEEYLASIAQPFRRDESNTRHEYTRNWLRHDLIPRLVDRFGPTIGESVAGLSGQATEAQAFVLDHAAALKAAAVRVQRAENRITFDPTRGAAPPLVVREACRLAWGEAGWPEQGMGRREWDRLIDHLMGGPGQPPIMLPGGVRVAWADELFVLSRVC